MESNDQSSFWWTIKDQDEQVTPPDCRCVECPRVMLMQVCSRDGTIKVPFGAT